jgi:hypothetical protein
MKNLYCLLISHLLCLIIVSGSLYASVPNGVSLIKNSDGYTINFVLPSYKLNTETVGNEKYYTIEIPEYGVISEVGLPALPQLSFNMFISYQEANPSVNVISLSSEVKELKQQIYPFQQPWEKNNPLSERPFTIDRSYYNSAGKVYPTIEISEPFIINGVKGVIVTIHPFNYNPVENKLTIVNSGEFRLNLNNYVSPVFGKSRSFNNFFKNIFANYEYSTEMSGGNYLIITAPAYESDLTPFVDFKVSTGFTVDVFNTNTTGTTNTAIKAFIQQRYDNLATRPDYILLVGDVANIPSWTGSGSDNPTTDLNYVQLEGGDYFADAFIGRYSVTNVTHLGNAIDKSIFMESYVGSLDKKNVFMASNDNYTISEGTHNYVIDTYFDPAGYTNLKLYCHTYNATTQQLINALNDNQIFAIYSGHGSETSWADGPPLNQSQVNALTNTWYPYVYSFACLTGSFGYSECFGETWLRTAHGASSFYGSSVTSYWDEDDVLERNVIKAMFEDELTRVTPMFVQGMIYLVDHYGGINGTTLRYMEMYNLMGDPSLPVVETLLPCPVEEATNPNPPDGATDIPIFGNTLTWTNGAGANNIEIWFGPMGSLAEVYNGTPITSFTLAPCEPLLYGTTYGWQIIGLNDTCTTNGPIWTFTTMQDPNLVLDTIHIHPISAQYWTGTTNGSTKTDGEVNTIYPNVGWVVFDLSSFPPGVDLIDAIQFYGYVNATNWPYWSATPMGSVNPILDPAASIYAQVNSGYEQGTAYIYSDESSGFPVGWHDYPLEAGATTDLFNSLVQGWFAMGFIDRDFTASYYLNFDGWSQNNPPYLVVNYVYLIPVELSSFTATVNESDVTLDWATSTETNNQGFEILRSAQNDNKGWQKIGYVAGYGTTTEPKAYSFVDTKLETGSYIYRLKQIDQDGTYKYSEEVNVDVEVPIEYALEQNYPNPFNPSTTIKYSIPEDGFVKLAVYNMLGEQVATLVNAQQKSGKYEINFNASNLASGIYLYRLEAQNYVSIKKMILVK